MKYCVYISGHNRYVIVEANSDDEARTLAFNKLTDYERQSIKSPNQLWIM